MNLEKWFHLFRRGQRLPDFSASLWIHGAAKDDFRVAESLIAALRTRSTKHKIVLTASTPEALQYLRRRFPNDFVLQPPPDQKRGAIRFFRSLSPQILILLTDYGQIPFRSLRVARDLNVPVALVHAESFEETWTGSRGGDKSAVRLLSLVAIRTRRDLESWQKEGIPACRICVTGPPGGEGADVKTLRALEAVLPGAEKGPPPLDGWWATGAVPRLSRTKPGRSLANRLAGGRISSLSALKKRLGRPASILCLGNGPTSENLELESMEWDCLFRTNWRWKERRFLDQPDLVFVGSFETVRRVENTIFGFRDQETERVLLLGSLLRPWRVPLEFVTIETLPTALSRMELEARPSSGAFMIVLASALEPERLIISGMDLFQHPAGRYPGDSTAVNAYAQAHDRNVDVEVIQQALESFQGDLVILSDNLRKALDVES